MDGIMTECLQQRVVHLREVKTVMLALMTGSMTKCPLQRSVLL